jgi:pectinesterase
MAIAAEFLDKSDMRTLSGTVFLLGPLPDVSITVLDSCGRRRTTRSDAEGRYRVGIEGLSAPLLVHADEGRPAGGRGLPGLLSAVAGPRIERANVNALTDRMVAEAAASEGIPDPACLLEALSPGSLARALRAEALEGAAALLRPLVSEALGAAGLPSPESWNPATSLWSEEAASVLGLIRHGRGYEAATGSYSEVMLLDIAYWPLSPADALDYGRALEDRARLADPELTHVYLASDSTCCSYESGLAPRTGWGQALQSKLAPEARVMVVNVAQSGRSSRSFIEEGWLDMIARSLLPGDFLFVCFGHNDEKGGSLPPAPRDRHDIARLATYPNDARGRPQGGELSFQRSLERYISLARAKGATPVLLSPATRMLTGPDGKTGLLPLSGGTHATTGSNSRAPWLGDFAQTVRDTARANAVPLIDLERQTVAMANAAGEPGWKRLWLAVDPAEYPSWPAGGPGSLDAPDTTHFQERGASRIADIVLAGCAPYRELSRLAASALKSLESADYGTLDCPLLTDGEAARYTRESYLASAGTVDAPRPEPWFPLPVDRGGEADFTVGPSDGSGSYASVQEAVNAGYRPGSRKPVRIRLLPGSYEGAVYVPSDYAPLTIYGAGRGPEEVEIRLALDAGLFPEAWARRVNPRGQFRPGDPAWYMYEAVMAGGGARKVDTAASAVLWAQSDDFCLRNLSVTNAMLDDPASNQAVALRTDGDRVRIEAARLIGRQDTLWLNSGERASAANSQGAFSSRRIARAFVSDSYIEGDIDFVMGRANAVFEGCEFHVVSSRRRPPEAIGVVFAPDTLPDNPRGFLALGCRFTADSGYGAEGFRAALGRPWDQGTSASGYLPGSSPDGQLVIRDSLVSPSYNIEAPWFVEAATSGRRHLGNVHPERDLDDHVCGRLWMYRNRVG